MILPCTLILGCRKLTGTRYFNNGHGSLPYPGLLVTVPRISVFGKGNETAKSGSSQGRVAAYKVCWTPFEGVGCLDADILAALDAAISDGENVISTSRGGGTECCNNAGHIPPKMAPVEGVVSSNLEG